MTSPPDQGRLFPFATPLTLVATCRRIEAMVLTVAPEMTRLQCYRMQCDLCIPTLLLERMHPAATIPPRPIVALPETVLLYARDLERQISMVATELTQQGCAQLLRELLETTATMESISLEIRQGREWQTRHELPALPELTSFDPEADRLEEARAWRSVHKPIVYQRTQTPAWPDLGFVPGRRRRGRV